MHRHTATKCKCPHGVVSGLDRDVRSAQKNPLAVSARVCLYALCLKLWVLCIHKQTCVFVQIHKECVRRNQGVHGHKVLNTRRKASVWTSHTSSMWKKENKQSKGQLYKSVKELERPAGLRLFSFLGGVTVGQGSLYTITVYVQSLVFSFKHHKARGNAFRSSNYFPRCFEPLIRIFTTTTRKPRPFPLISHDLTELIWCSHFLSWQVKVFSSLTWNQMR